MRAIEIAVRLLASLAGGLCTYAFAVALLLATSFADFAARFAASLASLVTDPFTGPADGAPLSLTPYVFVGAMAAFYFAFPLISDLIRRRAGPL